MLLHRRCTFKFFLTLEAVKVVAGSDLDQLLGMRENDGSQMLITRFVKREPDAAGLYVRHEQRGPPLVANSVLPTGINFSAASLVRNKNAPLFKHHNGGRTAGQVVDHSECAGLANPSGHLPRPVRPAPKLYLLHSDTVKNKPKTFKWVGQSGRRSLKAGKNRGKTHASDLQWIGWIPGSSVKHSGATFRWVTLSSKTPVAEVLPVAKTDAPARPGLAQLLAKQMKLKIDAGDVENILEAASDAFMDQVLKKLADHARLQKRLKADLWRAEQQQWTHNDPKYSYAFSQHFQVGAPAPVRGTQVLRPYFKSTVITADTAYSALFDEAKLRSLPSLHRFLQVGALHK